MLVVLLEMMTKVLLFITRTSGGKARVRMTPLPPRSSKLRLYGTCKQRRKVRPCWRRERLLAIIIHLVEMVTLTAVVRMWMELLHPLQHDPRLAERSFGDWEGMSWSEIEQEFPNQLRSADSNPKPTPTHTPTAHPPPPSLPSPAGSLPTACRQGRRQPPTAWRQIWMACRARAATLPEPAPLSTQPKSLGAPPPKPLFFFYIKTI